MKKITTLFALLFLLLILAKVKACSQTRDDTADTVNNNDALSNDVNPHPFSLLPGDPSMNIITNVDLGSHKMNIMKGNIAKN